MTIEFAAWIGRSASRRDTVTSRLLGEYRATLGSYLFEVDGKCPPGLHWGIAPALPDAGRLGEDGAEVPGEFLPPVPLPRRMWAGGSVETIANFESGMDVTRVSTVTDVVMREGSSGTLCFVTIHHEMQSDGALLLRERQDLVFRSAASPPRHVAQIPAPAATWLIEPTPQLLFRFSAFTFNSHRIHYDRDYAVGVEGYPGVLVHGPLQAALLLNQSAIALGKIPRQFQYRCRAPLAAGPAFGVGTDLTDTGTYGAIRDAAGIVTCEATAA